jgi:hypothetical protein
VSSDSHSPSVKMSSIQDAKDFLRQGALCDIHIIVKNECHISYCVLRVNARTVSGFLKILASCEKDVCHVMLSTTAPSQ